jgi:hypothetical protein
MLQPTLLLLDGLAAAPDALPVWSPGSELPAMLSRFFAPPPPYNVWQNAERAVVLDPKQSPGNSGPYRAATTPWTKFLQEKFTDPTVRQITIKKNSQGAFTQAVLNCIVYCVEHDPRNVLYVIDSLQEARRIAKIRLLPTLLRWPGTAQAFTEDANDKTSLTVNMRDMFMMFAGGGSIGAVANKPIELGVVDEADKIPRITGGHGHVVHEMKARFKTVENGKLIVLSAPNEEQDVTTQEYNLGSQHKLFCPCPHCGHFQELVQERVKFDHCKKPTGQYDKERVLREAYYLCEQSGTSSCPEGKIYEHHRPAMIDRGEWRATNPDAEPFHISIHSSDLISTFPEAALGKIALDMITMFRNPLKRRSIQRDRFGLEYRPRKAELKTEDLLKLVGPYNRGEMPAECVYVGIGSDYQGTGPKWVKGAWARNEDLYIVDWGDPLSIGDISRAAAAAVIERRLGRPDRECFTIGGLLDEGWRQKEVLKFCLEDARKENFGELRFFSSKGRGNIQNAGALVVESPRKCDGVEMIAYQFNADKFKAAFYVGKIAEFDQIKNGRVKRPRIWLPKDVTEDFLLELMGEALLPEVTERGFTRYSWKKIGPNHWGDAVIGLEVLWHVVGGDVLDALPPEEKAA